jgi:hypothetical protein
MSWMDADGNGTTAPNASVTNGSTVEAKNDPIILEVRMYPGLFPKCLLVFFDSRNLDPLNDRMSRILLLAEPGPGPTVGKIDSQNEWVASKVERHIGGGGNGIKPQF